MNLAKLANGLRPRETGFGVRLFSEIHWRPTKDQYRPIKNGQMLGVCRRNGGKDDPTLRASHLPAESRPLRRRLLVARGDCWFRYPTFSNGHLFSDRLLGGDERRPRRGPATSQG